MTSSMKALNFSTKALKIKEHYGTAMLVLHPWWIILLPCFLHFTAGVSQTTPSSCRATTSTGRPADPLATLSTRYTLEPAQTRVEFRLGCEVKRGVRLVREVKRSSYCPTCVSCEPVDPRIDYTIRNGEKRG